jgi:hypothetical protein
MEKTVKMRFQKDMYYEDQNVPLYKGGEDVDVPERMVSRWLKRGGMLVADLPKPPAPAPAPAKAPDKPVQAPVGKGNGKK